VCACADLCEQVECQAACVGACVCGSVWCVSESVYVRERERVCVCVCVSVREGDKERERERVWERVLCVGERVCA